MIKKIILPIAIILTLTAPIFANQAHAKNFTKEQVEKMIEEYILNNGDKIIQGVDNFQKKQQEATNKGATEKIAQNQAYINDPANPSTGDANADVTIVEFFDYNCGYCKRAFADIQKIAKTDTKTRFVFLEMPILGPTSLTAAKWSVAAHEQGKYFEYHTAIMNHKGPKTEAELEKLAKNLGLDVKKMKKTANSDKTQAVIQKSMDFAKELGIRGTPAFIMGDELARGYIGADGLKAKIAELRNKK